MSVTEKKVQEAAAYLPKFQEDLSAWFTITDQFRRSWGGCRCILHMEDHFNKERHWAIRYRVGDGKNVPKMPVISPADQYMFAAAVCVMVLIMQVVCRVKGREAALECCRKKDWPVCSAGLGGFLHPLHMMREAQLLPEEGTGKGHRDIYIGDLEAMCKLMTVGLDEYVNEEVRSELDFRLSGIRDWISCAEGASKEERRYPDDYPPAIVGVCGEKV